MERVNSVPMFRRLLPARLLFSLSNVWFPFRVWTHWKRRRRRTAGPCCCGEEWRPALHSGGGRERESDGTRMLRCVAKEALCAKTGNPRILLLPPTYTVTGIVSLPPLIFVLPFRNPHPPNFLFVCCRCVNFVCLDGQNLFKLKCFI